MPPIDRRTFLGACTMTALGARMAGALSLSEPGSAGRTNARSVILLWLDGGPSQLETFDPHPGGEIGGPTKGVRTSLPGVQFAAELPRLAEAANDLVVLRSVTSKEGDHERGRYFFKTGNRPIPTVVHPALGSICAAELPEIGGELPRYLTIQSDDRRAGGGYLGDGFDPVMLGDPESPPRNVVSHVDAERRARRASGLEVVEASLARRSRGIEARTLHREQLARARRLMDSEQLSALQIESEPASVRARYGQTPFGRGALAARRLVEAGVRCVEVQLGGWDSHADNFGIHRRNAAILDDAVAGLLADLKARGLWDDVLVVCAGEFGRTPRINGLDGRDHWTNGFSVVLAGGGLPRGVVVGETDPDGRRPPKDPIPVNDLFATILQVMGIDPATEHVVPGGRPVKLCEGRPLERLLAS